ncbi:alpha/beta-hydrolase [Cristinia sonorae]|uniref:Alpha/beta-hydrolase n=1 Tax=Cristinia sonorae TaxID=1940300 RepID=A0A8K0UFE6_9AGAR|nr:alpha/beta-hydrolase [Cristinia sonorae]
MPHSEKPFKLSVPDADIDYLRKKLEFTRFPDHPDGMDWQYGVPIENVRRLVARWKDGFDWRAAEARINQFPQFTRDIEVEGFGTLNIHYVHKKSEAKGAIPLLFVHGWPGHFMEVSKILPLLTSNAGHHAKFHVVALSLPGFGFSEAPKKKGFKIRQFAEVGHKLMLALGYNKYVVQGGDWGFTISRNIAYYYGPEYVKAWHTNMPYTGPPTFAADPLLYLQYLVTPLSPQDVQGLKRNEHWYAEGRGFTWIQQTRPQTIGSLLADSPTGLLAWIYEKLIVWVDHYHWTDDEVLEWVSIYWYSRAGPAASVRIYYEYYHDFEASQPPWSPVPFGASHFPKDVFYSPSLWVRALGNVVYEVRHDVGGHFAAHEQPEILVDDIRALCELEVVSKEFDY